MYRAMLYTDISSNEDQGKSGLGGAECIKAFTMTRGISSRTNLPQYMTNMNKTPILDQK